MNLENAISLAIPLVRNEEGFASKAYWDVNGYAIGYGNHYYKDGSAVKQGDTITKSAADDLQRFYVRQFAKEIEPSIKVDINDHQMAALISLAYNCGSGVRNYELFKLINAKAPADQIEEQYKKTCVTAKSVYNAGLFDRRLRELKVFMSDAVSFAKENKWQIAVTGALFFGLIGFYIWRLSKEK